MQQLHTHNTARIFSAGGTFGEAQIVTAGQAVVLDLQTRHFDVLGHARRDHATARMALIEAVMLRDMLSQAIEHARAVDGDDRQGELPC
jgi:hypothetical protein